MDIAGVIERIEAGDRQAFAEVVERFQHPLFGFLGRMGLNQAVADEIAQETFVRAWQNLNQYQPRLAGFSTWLFTIARNLALNELSRENVRRDSAGEVALHCVEHPQEPPSDLLQRDQNKLRLNAALRKLPLTERTLLALAYVREMQLTDVAALEGSSVGAIKVRIHRAKAKLREWLETSNG